VVVVFVGRAVAREAARRARREMVRVFFNGSMVVVVLRWDGILRRGGMICRIRCVEVLWSG
jgi:hypothetical protein